jgi:hypothetical protein
MATRVKRGDVSVQNEGTIFLFTANTDIAREWISENVQEDAMYFGGSLVVEHRYAAVLARSMADDGLTID